MKAVVYEETRQVAVHEVDDAVLQEPSDVVIRVTSSAICGTDLHMYDGRTGAEPGLVGFGRTHDRRYTTLLRDLVVSGRARPGAIITHHGRLDDAPRLFTAFDERAEGVIKAVLRP